MGRAIRKPLKERIRESRTAVFLGKHKGWFISAAVLVALVLCFTLPFIEKGLNKDSYDIAFNDYKDLSGMEEKVELTAEVEGGVSAHGDEAPGKVKLLTVGDKAEYKADVTKAGPYELRPYYKILGGGFSDEEFSVVIDGKPAVRTKLRPEFRFENRDADFATDRHGNEIVPMQTLMKGWRRQGLRDLDFLLPRPMAFHLETGEHVIELSLAGGDDVMLSDLLLVGQRKLVSYEKYALGHEDDPAGARLADDKLIQGERFLYKNDTAPLPESVIDQNAFPYDSVKKMLNALGNFDRTDQTVTYDFEIPSDGLYVFNFNYQVRNSNHATFATIFLDGEIPFGELLHYPFQDTSRLEEDALRGPDGKPFLFHLDAGVHELGIKIDGSLMSSVTNELAADIRSLSAIYLDLKRIAGTIRDNNKEWDPGTDFPGITEELQALTDGLRSLIPTIKAVNSRSANFPAVIFLNGAINSLEGILKKPALIPNNYRKFSEGTGSIIESLSNAKSDLETTPLEIDRVIVGSPGDYRLRNRKNAYDRFFENIRKFFLSFTQDYGAPADKMTLDIWVARSRQYVDLMQETFAEHEEEFKEETGYDVRFTLLADESKLILSNAAKISPDGVMGISNWLPYEMGIRDLTVDLTKFDDYKDVIGRFSPGALISLIADGRGVGLPETQDFYVTYYRKDITERYGYEVPDTWDDVLDLLPRLERNGFNFYIPLSASTAAKPIMSTAPFIYQYGGNLFSDDGLTTTLDEENSLAAIRFMTELYTLYGLQSQVVNFFDSFRNGSLPIGVSTFDTYVKLTLGAPELAGLWGIKLSPGKVQPDGSIARWQTGSAQSMCLIDKDEARNKAGWELLKWWSSADVQAEFAQKLTLRYGKGYIWNSANLDAFSRSIIFKPEQKQVILEQWKYMREIPRVPGWYMLERELSNSWNRIVLQAENTRAVIEDAVTIINKELRRKLIEFGYLDAAGKILKPYKVTTLESIEDLKRGGAA